MGTEANASCLLVSVCSEYKFWGALVAQVDPAAQAVITAAFDIDAARQLLLRAFEEAGTDTSTAGSLKNKMLLLDPSFDERNYGCRSCRDFRDFLSRFPDLIQQAGHSGGDITIARTTGSTTS